jgi:hypothetical protein
MPQVGHPRTDDRQVVVADLTWCAQRCHEQGTEAAPPTRGRRVAQAHSGGVTEYDQARRATPTGKDGNGRKDSHTRR